MTRYFGHPLPLIMPIAGGEGEGDGSSSSPDVVEVEVAGPLPPDDPAPHEIPGLDTRLVALEARLVALEERQGSEFADLRAHLDSRAPHDHEHPLPAEVKVLADALKEADVEDIPPKRDRLLYRPLWGRRK